MHLGHRFSFDLDFFCRERFSIDEVLQTLKALGQLETFQVTADTFNGKLNDARISFFIYPYPTLGPFQTLLGAQVASLEDLAAMKVDAITRRGRKRDFVDLYFISQRAFSLEHALSLYFQKFREFNISRIHVYKSLMYFDDAEADEMPEMIERVKWDDVKHFFQKEAQIVYRRKMVE